MFMTTRTKIDSWSTDNCCLKASLRTGTIIIALISLPWQGVASAWFGWATSECWSLDMQNCSLFPESERKLVETIVNATREQNVIDFFNLNTGKNISIFQIEEVKQKDIFIFGADILTTILCLFFGLYFIFSLLILIGVYKNIHKLLLGWVYSTMLLMTLVLSDLVITLPFITMEHLLGSITVFVVSLYMWAVVRSYMIDLRRENNKLPLPENAVREFSVDGVQIGAIPIEGEDL